MLSLAASTVTLRLSGTEPPPGQATGSADGDYLVDLCGSLPGPGAPLDRAIATTNLSGSIRLLSNAPASCADPDAVPTSCVTERTSLSIELPVAMQAVGTYPLDGLGHYRDCLPFSTTCLCNADDLWNGTIAIKSIDATSIAFDLAGTDGILWRQPNVDGSFVATRCP